MVYLRMGAYNYNMRKRLLEQPELLEEVGITCDHPHCERPGLYRAPKTRALEDYYQFCQEHVRDYNARWDYYHGMNAEEIEKSRWDDYTWNRPTKIFGNVAEGTGFNYRQAEEFIRKQAFQGDKKENNDAENNAASPYVRDIQKALAKLGIRSKPKNFKTVQERYKVLAKRYHPDANQGDAEKENRLKEINQAYTLLRGFRDMFV